MWRVKSRATSPRDVLPKLFDISSGFVPWRESGDVSEKDKGEKYR
jgi:hypothetical protein